MKEYSITKRTIHKLANNSTHTVYAIYFLNHNNDLQFVDEIDCTKEANTKSLYRLVKDHLVNLELLKTNERIKIIYKVGFNS